GEDPKVPAAAEPRSPNGTQSAARICSEIKWTVAVRGGATDQTRRAEIGANPPDPQGSQTAAAQCVERLSHSTAARCAALLLGDSPFANRIVSYLSPGALTELAGSATSGLGAYRGCDGM
ncbi:MAG: hypothetical protein ACR2PI_13200, partial [Hyphomicrobiaceae bacterium]